MQGVNLTVLNILKCFWHGTFNWDKLYGLRSFITKPPFTVHSNGFGRIGMDVRPYSIHLVPIERSMQKTRELSFDIFSTVKLKHCIKVRTNLRGNISSGRLTYIIEFLSQKSYESNENYLRAQSILEGFTKFNKLQNCNIFVILEFKCKKI